VKITLPAHLLERKLIGKSTLDVLILAGRVQMVSAHLQKAQNNKYKRELRRLKCFCSMQASKDQTPQQAETIPVNNTTTWTGVCQHGSELRVLEELMEQVFYKHSAPVSLFRKNQQKKEKTPPISLFFYFFN